MKILLLGSSGFVGHNLHDDLKSEFELILTTRTRTHYDPKALHFDLSDSSSWDQVIAAKPDLVINALAYGVVKNETELELMYSLNYFSLVKFYEKLRSVNRNLFWIQIGTAFEYDLFKREIDENTNCVPFTHYGISKLVFSNYLLASQDRGRFCIIRPFALFGPYEDKSKIIPALILAQLNSDPLPLSHGNQFRDYTYVQNLSFLVKNLALKKNTDHPVINLGSGKAYNLKQLAGFILKNLTVADESLWNWGSLEPRQGEPESFYSSSLLAGKLMADKFVNLETGLQKTISYYQEQLLKK